MINTATEKPLDSRYKQFNTKLPTLCEDVYDEFGKRYTPEQLNYVLHTSITFLRDYIEKNKDTALKIRIQNFGVLKLVGTSVCKQCKRGTLSKENNGDGTRTVTCRKCNHSYIQTLTLRK
jgi:hypothetical protein